jgi:hypothetical protein
MRAHVGVSEPWFTTVSQVDFASVLGSNLFEFLIDVFDDELGGVLDTKVGHQSDRELALYRTWNDSLGSRSGCSQVSAHVMR